MFDHLALAAAGEGGRPVIALFVLDPAILQRPDTGASRVAYLAGALAELDAGLRRRGSALVIRRGNAREVIPAVAAEAGAGLVTAVRDFEPFARARDSAVADALHKDGRALWLSPEQLVLDPVDQLPFRTFRACLRRFDVALANGIAPPPPIPGFLPASRLPQSDPMPGTRAWGLVGDRVQEPGERAAATRLAVFIERRLAGYASARDDPAADATSHLSADLRFGALSARTAIRAAVEFGRVTPHAERGVRAWLNELAWRDFYASVLWHFPEVETLEFNVGLRGLRWSDPDQTLSLWQQGFSGGPTRIRP